MESSLTCGILHGKSICRFCVEITGKVYPQRQFRVNCEVIAFCEPHGANLMEPDFWAEQGSSLLNFL